MFHIFRPPSATTLIQRQLAEADRDFLEAAKLAEYWSTMADMLNARRKRLQGYMQLPTEVTADDTPAGLTD